MAPKRNQDYDFFEEMDSYLTLETQIKQKNEKEEKKAEFCDNITHDTDSNVHMIKICKEFVKIFLYSKKEYSGKNSTVKSKYYKFLNYWLNRNLISLARYDYVKDVFYRHININLYTFGTTNELNDKIYEMEISTIKNMSMLYNLYKHYLDLKHEQGNFYKTFVKELKDKYNEALEKCFSGGGSKFCNALNDFKNFYENDRPKMKKCTTEKICPSLPELILPKSIDNKDLITAKKSIQLIRSGTTRIANGLSTINQVTVY
ncbi:hypothetical protein PVC01_110005800 [Plasmodium vivax]|uniref:VIR protein n=1 Tax=Plasmodium vivax TaxID=5855 RepID=A0A1G4HEN4_PLAVI|nr:hypothetical protein PVC01_110005800 [Plasmodium vivax]